MQTIKWIFFFTSILGITNCLEAQVKKVATGKSLPDIELTTLNEKKVNLSSYGKNGKITILLFWATWCTPCKSELNSIAKIYVEWQTDYAIELLAISIDNPKHIAKVKSYVDKENWKFKILLDSKQELMQVFNFDMPPYTVLTNKEGLIVSINQGYKDGDEFILEGLLKEIAGNSSTK